MTRREIEQQLNNLDAELVNINSISERKVREEYNVDSKGEAIDMVQDNIRIHEALLECSDEDSADGLDAAFGSWTEFWRYKF